MTSTSRNNRALAVAVAQGSLTDGRELVLVNASNTNVALGTGVSGAIRQACGPGYQQHLTDELQRQLGRPLAPGEVLLTDAGSHPTAKWVVHVAVMDYREGFNGSSYPTLATVRSGCERLWRVLETLPEPVSVAMVALGAGTGNLGVREPTQLAAETLKAHLAATSGSRIERVVFYGYALHEALAMAEVLRAQFPTLQGP